MSSAAQMNRPVGKREPRRRNRRNTIGTLTPIQEFRAIRKAAEGFLRKRGLYQ